MQKTKPKIQSFNYSPLCEKRNHEEYDRHGILKHNVCKGFIVKDDPCYCNCHDDALKKLINKTPLCDVCHFLAKSYRDRFKVKDSGNYYLHIKFICDQCIAEFPENVRGWFNKIEDFKKRKNKKNGH